MENKLKKRKLLTMLGITTTLSLTGCSYKGYGNQMSKEDIINNFISYDQDYSYDSISYEVLSQMYIGIFNNDNVYLMIIPHGYKTTYYDYFTGALLKDYYKPIDKEEITFETFEVQYFLEKYGFIKNVYTNDDLIKLLSWIKRDYMINDEHKLILKKENK